MNKRICFWRFEISILSIQSHVAYGYVGNKAAVYPLQSMGYDVWPVNTVQFSNHTGYGKWQGEIFSADHIRNVIQGIVDLGMANQCQAILSGYMGSAEICEAVQDTVKNFKAQHPNILYLCDPVMGNNHCFVKPEVVEFFRTSLIADIITPNQFEAELLTGITITNFATLKQTASYLHDIGVKIVVITGLKLAETSKSLNVFVSDNHTQALIQTQEVTFPTPVNGTGDLLSAIYLGSYLANKNIILALQHVVYFMEKVLNNTFLSKERELQVLSEKYELSTATKLPEIMMI